MSSTSPVPVVLLPDRTRDIVAAAASRTLRYDLVTDPERFATEAQIQSAGLPEQLRRELISFRRFGNAAGGLLIRQLPIGDIPETPGRADAAVGATLGAAASMSVLLALLGEQLGYRPELGGNLVQDVLPVAGNESEQMSTGSAVDLKTHIEMAFSDHRSDYVALLCVRPDHERVAGTTLSSIDRMLPLLEPATIRVLREPRFRTKVDASFLRGDNLAEEIWIGPSAILEGSSSRPRLRVDFAETEGSDREACRALAELNAAAVETQLVVRLDAGDLLIADNNRALHGRTRFQPRYDGADRWLLRAFVMKDLARSEAVRPANGRVVEPHYEKPESPLAKAARRHTSPQVGFVGRGY